MDEVELLEKLGNAWNRIVTGKAFIVKAVFLAVMVLIGHHHGIIPFSPIKIPIAHGINQLLGAIAGLAVGVAILVLTNRLLGW